MNCKNILIITATIEPLIDAPNLSRVDVSERMGDYKKALLFYVHCLEVGVINKIVFVDNSNYDLNFLKKIISESNSNKDVEFISYFGLDYPSGYGRGYGEFKLIEYAMMNSSFINAASNFDNIWKVTGRYIVKNLNSLVDRRPMVDIYCNCRNYPIQWLDLYILSWSKGVYFKVLSDVYLNLREDNVNHSSEVIFRNFIDSLGGEIKIYKRFLVEPKIEGVRGLDNKKYENMKVKYLIRSCMRFFFPNFWA